MSLSTRGLYACFKRRTQLEICTGSETVEAAPAGRALALTSGVTGLVSICTVVRFKLIASDGHCFQHLYFDMMLDFVVISDGACNAV